MFYGITSKIKQYLFNQIIFLAHKTNDRKNFALKISSYKKILLITGKNSYKLSGSKLFIENLLIGKEVQIFNNFDVNPDIEQIFPGSQIAKKYKPDLVIAIGGGSVIDAAKIIHYIHCNNLNKNDVFLSKIDNMNNKNVKSIPFVAIPTTAGTGTESTHFAVLYRDKKKFSIASKKMLPNIVYLDQSLCASNTPYQNACSGFDALSQAIESYWSRSSNILSRWYSKKAINLILDNFTNIINKKDVSQLSMLNMLMAANYAGKAINITKTTAPHALSYGITKNLNLPHGHAVAITLGAFFKIHDTELGKNDSNKKLLKHYTGVKKFLLRKLNSDPSNFLYKLMKDFSLEYDLNQLGLTEELIDEIVKNVNLERLENHPIKLSTKHLKNSFYFIPNKLV